MAMTLCVRCAIAIDARAIKPLVSLLPNRRSRRKNLGKLLRIYFLLKLLILIIIN